MRCFSLIRSLCIHTLATCTLVAALLLFLASAACLHAAEDAPNAALATAGTLVYVSSSPNPAWTPDQAIDGLVDATHGWIAAADGDTAPWIALEFPEPVRVETIVFYQAGLTEAGENRFARPRRLRIYMDNTEPRTVTLEDRERVPQRLTIDPVRTSVVKIDILSTYGDARFHTLTGFQEIEIYEGALAVGENEARVAESQPEDTTAAYEEQGGEQDSDQLLEEIETTVLQAGRMIDEKNNGAQENSGHGLDADERELLILLRKFADKLEQYMMDN